MPIRTGSTTAVSGWQRESPRRWRSNRIEIDPQAAAIDLRSIGGGNIAHAMISGVVRVLVARHALAESGFGGRLISIVPADVAPFVRDLYQAFEIEVLPTNRSVYGRIVEVEFQGEQAIQLASDLLQKHLNTTMASEASGLPSRVFLARRGARSIENLCDVEQVLGRKGFVTVYPERLSVLDQLKLLWQAEEVVGVHGAAFALLLPRAVQDPRRPLRVVEVFGPGYVTSLYRCLASNLGAAWIGVRGRVTPEVVRDLEIRGDNNWRYRSARVLRGWIPGRWLPSDDAWQRTHQLSSFEVDVQSLDHAIELIRDPGTGLPARIWDPL